jgi:hypothetical protein
MKRAFSTFLVISMAVGLAGGAAAGGFVLCARPDGVQAFRQRCIRGEVLVALPTPGRDLPLASSGGSAEYECQSSPGHYTCTCHGEGSADCDALFAACDFGGGLFSCASDYGVEGDMCGCEYY